MKYCKREYFMNLNYILPENESESCYKGWCLLVRYKYKQIMNFAPPGLYNMQVSCWLITPREVGHQLLVWKQWPESRLPNMLALVNAHVQSHCRTQAKLSEASMRTAALHSG